MVGMADWWAACLIGEWLAGWLVGKLIDVGLFVGGLVG